jgi:hypothetical protein
MTISRCPGSKRQAVVGLKWLATNDETGKENSCCTLENSTSEKNLPGQQWVIRCLKTLDDPCKRGGGFAGAGLWGGVPVFLFCIISQAFQIDHHEK